jgi:predicted amidohydrolase
LKSETNIIIGISIGGRSKTMKIKSYIPIVLIFALAFTVASFSSQAGELKVASVKMPLSNNVQQNLALIKTSIEEASSAGARVVVFPKFTLCKTGVQVKAHRKIASLAKKHKVCVIYGAFIKSPFERSYNGAIVVNPEGVVEEEVHQNFPENQFESGEKISLFRIDDIPSTLILSNDSKYPELVRLSAVSGARICFFLNSEGSAEIVRSTSIAKAVENGFWVVQLNGDFATVMVDPSGKVVVNESKQNSKISYTTIDPEKADNQAPLRGTKGKMLSGRIEPA